MKPQSKSPVSARQQKIIDEFFLLLIETQAETVKRENRSTFTKSGKDNFHLTIETSSAKIQMDIRRTKKRIRKPITVKKN